MIFARPMKAVSVNTLKSRLSEYLGMIRHRMYRGFVVQRYGRDVALLLPVPTKLEMEADQAKKDLYAYMAFEDRVTNGRRIAMARVLSSPAYKKLCESRLKY